jgi:hypothetical protein
LLRAYIRRYGTTPDGRIFQTARAGILQDSGYNSRVPATAVPAAPGTASPSCSRSTPTASTGRPTPPTSAALVVFALLALEHLGEKSASPAALAAITATVLRHPHLVAPVYQCGAIA